MNYYNENDSFSAQWLNELIKEGLIAKGIVDTRSIKDVEAKDLKEFKQCHFFAGIGGWAYATRLAEWEDDRPVWTGSPPCQPFSVAGKQKGTEDKRHLWPTWFNLIKECRPSTIFGEQVASSVRHGWLDTLQEDLEAENYACGSIVLPASSVGAFHKRDRVWFVAHSDSTAKASIFGNSAKKERVQEKKRESKYCTNVSPRGSESDERQGVRRSIRILPKGEYSIWSEVQPVQCKDGKTRLIPTEPALFPLVDGVSNRMGILRGTGNAIVPQVAAKIIGLFV
jgi:DNA (cytosine-5)-methyltransferase 1|tara:strand:+ start:63 stop:908 length:846 start_codon:yes stop_codon:yes gene_type:complete